MISIKYSGLNTFFFFLLMEYKNIGNEIYNITIRQMFRNKIQIKWNKFSDVKYPAWRLNRSVKWIKWRGKSEFVLVSHGSSHLWSNSSSGSGICSWIQVLDYQSNGDEVERDFLKMKGRMSFACILLRRDCWLEMIHRRYRLLWFTMYLKMIVLTI